MCEPIEPQSAWGQRGNVIFDREELGRLYRYCVALTGDQDTAWDLLQASYARFLRAAPTRLANPRAYFMRVIRSCSCDETRRAEVRRRPARGEVEWADISPVDQKALDEIVIERDEVERLLLRLSQAEREMLYLWAVEGWTASEIGDHLSRSRGTVLSQIHRLKGKISTIVAEESDVDEGEDRRRR